MMHILRRIWEAWKRVGQVIGDFIARIVLSIFYFTVFVPFVLAVKLFRDPLRTKVMHSSSWWLERSTHDLSLEDGRRQS